MTAGFRDHDLHPLVVTALGTGMRRGELLALRWIDVDLDGNKLRIERALEETKAGLRVKPPKTAYGKRTITLPASVVDVLRDCRRQQVEKRLALGLGKFAKDALVFPKPTARRVRLGGSASSGLRRLSSCGYPR